MDVAKLHRTLSAADSGYDFQDDDDGRSYSEEDVAKDIMNQAVKQPVHVLGAIVTDKSENVLIGDRTHYHSRVTVVVSETTSEVLLSPATLLVRPSWSKQPDGHVEKAFYVRFLPKRRKAVIIGFAGFVAVIVLVAIALVVSLAVSPESPEQDGTAFSEEVIMVRRDDWLARPRKGVPETLKLPISLVVVHHSNTSTCLTKPVCSKMMREIQSVHMVKWLDIGYNFVIGGDGLVYEARGWEWVGAHTLGYNWISVGICLMGSFDSVHPTARQMKSLHQLVKYGVMLGKIDGVKWEVAGACQLKNTISPGMVVMVELRKWDRCLKNATSKGYCR